MKQSLYLNDHGTRKVLRDHKLSAGFRLGRGTFCAVYEKSKSQVLKLTTAHLQYESAKFYFEGPHFPEFIEDFGMVGVQSDDVSLFLYAAGKLSPVKKADPATRRLARQLLKKTSDAALTYQSQTKGRIKKAEEAIFVLSLLTEDMTLPQSLRQAFETIEGLCLDYEEVLLDVHMANLMVRGQDELVLNDIVVLDSELQRLFR